MKKVIDQEIGRSTAGLMYAINKEDRTVRRLAQPLTGFIENKEADDLDPLLEFGNTKILHHFIRAKFPDTVLKQKAVHVADYKIRFKGHGYQIIDNRKFGKVINMNKYNNDYPNPETVMVFIAETIGRPIEKEITELPKREEIERGELMKLASLGRLTVKPKAFPKEIKLPEPIAPVTPSKKDRLHMELERYYVAYKNKKVNYKLTLAKLKQRAPRQLHKVLVDLLKGYKDGTVSWRKLAIDLKKTVAVYQEDKKARVALEPIRQPRFEAPDLWEPIWPKVQTANVWHQVNVHHVLPKVVVSPVIWDNPMHGDGIVMGSNRFFETGIVDPDIVWMQFETRGPAGKKYEVKATLEEYLANVVLHHFPKAMPYLMKVAKGEMLHLAGREINERVFIRDPFEPYVPALLRYPLDRWEFCRACYEIIWQFEVEWFGMWNYTRELQEKQKIRVYSVATKLNDYGTVISTEAGVSIRYEHGTVDKLRLGEIVEPLNWK